MVDNDPHRPVPPAITQLIGYDYSGWCQFPTGWWNASRQQVWGDYRPSPEWMERLNPAVRFIGDCTLIGIQIRRGDYGQGSCYDAITPVEWYLDWLERHFNAIDRPVVFVATEDRDIVREFAQYNPVTVEGAGIRLRTDPYPRYNYLTEDLVSRKPHLIDWFPEWYMLTRCDILLAANSTFSLTAAMASRRCPRFWRPSWSKRAFVQENVWNCLPLRLDCPRAK